ncbi:2-oxoglutarate dehydrogenase complex E2 component [Chytridiales sp. JEL 0842]|nr:2-oxoglutarate dehydrogenase complex E2 component [Chytridiales sp. JEL 0842]
MVGTALRGLLRGSGLRLTTINNSSRISVYASAQRSGLNISLTGPALARFLTQKTIKVPAMGDSISEGTLTEWHKAVGDYVARDETVATIQTDKVDVTVNAPEAGVILQLHANIDDTVAVGGNLLELDLDGVPPAGGSKPAAPAAAPAPVAETKAPEPVEAAPTPEPVKVSTPAPAPTPAPSAPKPAPAQGGSKSDGLPGLVPMSRTERRVKMNRMRMTISKRLKESQNTAASLTTFNEIDMSNLMELRSKYKDLVLEKHGVKLGFMSAFIKAACHAAAAVPEVNARIEGDEVVYSDFVDISVAVATPKGLVTPVLRNCESLSMVEAEKAMAELGKKAKNNAITIEDMVGGTFTISNGGVFGSLYGTPIINQPQAAILGMHAVKERPVVVNGKIEIRPMMYVALTYDHRLIDGREAVTFLDPKRVPCGTVLEAAKAEGYMTGLVATSRITHATPASFSSHVVHRDMEDDIALQQIGNYTLGRNVDLMFGGGSCHFKPRGDKGSCRADELNLVQMSKGFGWKGFLETKEEFDAVRGPEALPLIALFAADHMNYEIDRDHEREPSLAEMAMKAIGLLSEATQNSNKGFFIMIEGSRIDMAAHSNDPAAHVREILAYNDAIKAVAAWVEQSPDTVMISVSDHETGGLAVAHQLGAGYPSYEWSPEVLIPVKNSTAIVGAALSQYQGANFADFVKTVVIPEWLGITNPTEEEVAGLSQPGKAAIEYDAFVAKMVSDRAQLGWATHGHSAVDVNLYAYGYRSAELRGNHENTEIGDFIIKVLDVDVDSVTKKLEGLNPSVRVVGDAGFEPSVKEVGAEWDSFFSEVAKELKGTGHFGEMDLEVDEEEHSIEMHLPYVYKIMEGCKKPFKIVPILVGAINPTREALYGRLLAPYLADPTTLFVISSDFCHWGSRFRYTRRTSKDVPIYKSIEGMDREGMDIIEKMDADGFVAYLKKTGNTICGRHPISVLLRALEHLKNDGGGQASVNNKRKIEDVDESVGAPKLEKESSAAVRRLKFIHYAQSSKVQKESESSKTNCMPIAASPENDQDAVACVDQAVAGVVFAHVAAAWVLEENVPNGEAWVDLDYVAMGAEDAVSKADVGDEQQCGVGYESEAQNEHGAEDVQGEDGHGGQHRLEDRNVPTFAEIQADHEGHDADLP